MSACHPLRCSCCRCPPPGSLRLRVRAGGEVVVFPVAEGLDVDAADDAPVGGIGAEGELLEIGVQAQGAVGIGKLAADIPVIKAHGCPLHETLGAGEQIVGERAILCRQIAAGKNLLVVQHLLELPGLEIEWRVGDMVLAVAPSSRVSPLLSVDLPLEVVREVGAENVSVNAELQPAKFESALRVRIFPAVLAVVAVGGFVAELRLDPGVKALKNACRRFE